MSGPRTAEHIQLTVDAGALRGRAQGTLDLTAVSGDLDYTLTATAMTPRPDLSWHSVDLQGRWHGTVSAPNADGHLLIKQLRVPGGTELADLNANLTATGGTLTARAVLTGLIIPGPQPRLLQDAPLSLDATVNMSDPKRPVDLKATHRLFELQTHATTADELAAQLDLRLPDVAPFAALGGQKIKGNALIKAQVTHDAKSTHITADADANIDAGTASWAGLIRGSNTRLQVMGAMTDEKFTIDKLQLTGRAVSLAADGTAARSATQDLDLRLEAALSDLAKLSPALVGTLKFSGKVSGPSKSLSTVADLTATVSIHGSPKGTVSAAVKADGLPNAPRGSVVAHGDLDGAPLHLDVALERDKREVVHAIIHHADWKSARIEGELASGTDLAQARGNLRLSMTQLSDLDRLLGSTLQGSVSGDVALTPVSGHSNAKINLQAQNVVAWRDHNQRQTDRQRNPRRLGHSTRCAVTGGRGRAGEHNRNGRALISVARICNSPASKRSITGQTVRLLSPATISFAEGLAIGGLKVGAREAILEVDGRISPTLDMRASLTQVKPDLVPGLLASGTVQANAELQGSTVAPTGKLHVEATGVHGANDAARGLPAVDMHADAQLMANTAKIAAKLTAGSASNLTLTGDAPLAADGALNLKLGGKLDIGLLNPLVEASGRHVTGSLTIDTTVTGATANPEIDGTIKLANGSVRDYTQGVNLTDITGEFTGSHGTLQIQTLTAKAAPGTVSITGTIGVLQPHIPVDLKLMAKNAQPIANNIITANLNADMHIGGTAREQLEVEGELFVNRATIEIPSGLPPDVAVLDVRRPGKGPPPKPEKPLVITLNVAVDAPRQILVKGRGLDSEMGGQIKIGGTTDVPIVSGHFELQKGSFTLGSSQLNFSSGTVTFNGQGLKKKIDPTLDFVAQTVAADVTATVKITGLADSPKIELSSTPDLPQDEIMARLLFGESAAQLTALQVVQIGAALASLGGGGGGLNPLVKLQKTLGLDRLTVGSDSTGQRHERQQPDEQRL